MEKFYFAQKAFIVNGGSLLLVQKSKDDPFHPGEWEVPGGRMEFGESVEEHILREVMEEVGLQIVAGEPFDIWTWQMNKKDESGGEIKSQVVAVARLCAPKTLKVTTDNRVEDDFLGEAKWVPFDELLNYKLIPDIIPVVENFLKKINN